MMSKEKASDGVYAVLLVGGKGKRLAPVSTEARPKAFLPITKRDETMFRKTLARVRKFVPPDRIVVVANKMHARLVRRDFPGIAKRNLVLEPVSRNTAPAIALASSLIGKRSPDAVLMALPSDHRIAGDAEFIRSLRTGVDFIKKRAVKDAFVVVGIKPRFPATGFGYIKLKSDGHPPGPGKVCEVEAFVEKPGLETAKDYLKDGRCMWNAGIFIFKAGSMLRAIAAFAPDISNTVKDIGKAGLKRAYEKLPDISIDYAVMERSDSIYCVEGNFDWQDMGDLKSLKEVLEGELKGLDRPASGKKALRKPSSLVILEKLRAMRL